MEYNALASVETIKKTIVALAERGFQPELLSSGAEALTRIKTFVPPGASVMNGSSRTLEEIGFIDYLKSGSQLPHLVFTSPNIILVVGAQKIMPGLDAAIARVKEYVYPLENKRMKEVGMGGSFISKLLIINREPAFTKRQFHVFLVNERLGF